MSRWLSRRPAAALVAPGLGAAGIADSVPGPEGDYVGPYEPVPEPGLPLSVATYGDRVYVSVTGSGRGRQDVVAVDAETGRVVERLIGANVYVHQMAMDSQGDIYVASVYPEHGGEARGAEGPSFVRWERK